MLFQKLFGSRSENKNNAPRFRKLRIESLESREMLSIDWADFQEIQRQYPDLGLSATAADFDTKYNIIEITDLSSDAKLRDAIGDARGPENDLIVVRTTTTNHTISSSTSNPLRINVDASSLGSVTIVSLGPEKLTIDAKQQSRVFEIGNGSEVILAGLTITGGKVDDYGGGIFNKGTLAIVDCNVVGNSITQYGWFNNYGGGIYNQEYSTLTVINSTVANNQASRGGGIYNDGTLIIKDSTISKNDADFDGGGIYNNRRMTIAGGEISENTASYFGTATGGGGGIYNAHSPIVMLQGAVTITGCTITGNSVSRQGYGGGIFNIGSGAGWGFIVEDCIITENSAEHGGGIYNSYNLYTFSRGNMAVVNSTIAGNSATSGGGIGNGGDLTVTNSVIIGNSASSGGGIRSAGTLTVTNSTIAGNSASSGGGIFLNSGTLTINNSIIAQNLGNDIHDRLEEDGSISGYNNLLGDKAGQFALREADDNLIGTAANPIDPMFERFTSYTVWNKELWRAWDLRLKLGSRAIDKGNNSLAVDADGKPLTVDRAGNPRISPTGGFVDIGAYEYQQAPITRPPDLKASDGGTISPPSVPKGSTFNVTTDLIENIGGTASGTYTITFYALTSSTQDVTSGIFLRTDDNRPSVAAGGSTIVTASNLPTASLTVGESYYIGWHITNVSGETVVDNNSARTTTRLSVTSDPIVAPNLEASDGGTVSPASVPKGNTFSVTTGAITNIGNAPADIYILTYYAYESNSPPASREQVTSGIRLGSYSMNTLAAGAVTRDEARNLSTTALDVGTYYICWNITNVNGETVTSNNWAYCPTRLSVTVTKLATPTLGNVDATGSNTISVAWNTVPNASSYVVEYSTSNSFPTTNKQSISVNDTSTILSDLAADTTYYVRVMAIGTGAYSNSDYSSVKSAKTWPIPSAHLMVSNGGMVPSVVVEGDTFSVTTGRINNVGGAPSGGYTLVFYALTNQELLEVVTFPAGIELGRVEMPSLAAGARTTAWLDDISTELLDVGESYHIAWWINGATHANSAAYRHGGPWLPEYMVTIALANTIPEPLMAMAGVPAPTYEISGPEDEILEKTPTYWEFSAVMPSHSAIRDWEVNWGDGSRTVVEGGPRSRISATHSFREPGTYTVTARTVDFDGVVNTITIGTYIVKERVVSSEWIPESLSAFETPEFLFPAEPTMVSVAAPSYALSENRVDNYLAGLMETMRQRQMLDLDQSGQKSESVSYPELIWDEELFGDEWLDFTESEPSDFWSEIFEDELDPRAILRLRL